MLNWFKKKPKKEKTSRIEEELKGKAVASMRYVVDKEGTVYLDFFWDGDTFDDANESFSILFSQINSGDLLEDSVKFIGETLKENDNEEEFTKFFTNLMEIQQAKIIETLGTIAEKSEEEVVVKPTDIASHVFKGIQT
jgi:hypothetical protein